MEKNLEKIINLTKKLISEEKYEQALEILKEEKTNPLNDLTTQSVLEDRFDKLVKFMKQNELAIKWNKADKSTLIKYFLTEGYEFQVLSLLLEKYGKDLTVADYYRLQQVLLDDSIPNESKLQYLKMFKDEGIKFKFQFHNANTNATFEVDTSKEFDIYEFEELFSVYDKLEALYFKEVSKDNLAKQLINTIYYYYFNDYSKLEYKGDDLFNNIVDYIENAFNSIYPLNTKFGNWINKLMK